MVFFMKKMIYSLLYIFLFFLLANQYPLDMMNSIIVHTQFLSPYYLYFVGFQMFWASVFYSVIHHYQQLDIFIQIRMSLKDYLKIAWLHASVLCLFYIALHSLLFLIFYQDIPFFIIIINGLIFEFLSLFVLNRMANRKYNYLYLIILILFSHFIV